MFKKLIIPLILISDFMMLFSSLYMGIPILIIFFSLFIVLSIIIMSGEFRYIRIYCLITTLGHLTLSYLFLFPRVITFFIHIIMLSYIFDLLLTIYMKRSKIITDDLTKELLSIRFSFLIFNNCYIDIDDKLLTPCEIELLELLCLYNYSNKEISFKLNKSPSTVKHQLKSIMDKTGANDRYHLIEMCKYNFM